MYRCESQRHHEGGKAHSALTPDGLIIWWEYGNGRTAKVLRPVESPADRLVRQAIETGGERPLGCTCPAGLFSMAADLVRRDCLLHGAEETQLLNGLT